MKIKARSWKENNMLRVEQEPKLGGHSGSREDCEGKRLLKYAKEHLIVYCGMK